MHQADDAHSAPEPGLVIALHCSGAGASQWRSLGEALDPAFRLAAPEHYGCESAGPWTGMRAFTLADEAQRTIDLIDQSEGKVHLVGHSYGGGVALHAALARPDRIASLSLYEPSAFHLLREIGDQGAAAFAEISGVARATGASVIAGDYAGAAKFFVDYWSGAGAWAALRPPVQAALIRWTPNATLGFHALIAEPTPLGAYRTLAIPTVILRGEYAPPPTRTIAEILPMLLPQARLAVLAGAGHMGPLTHADAVSEAITAHIRAANAAPAQQQTAAIAESGDRQAFAEAAP